MARRVALGSIGWLKRITTCLACTLRAWRAGVKRTRSASIRVVNENETSPASRLPCRSCAPTRLTE
jgi:hypothetical protein